MMELISKLRAKSPEKSETNKEILLIDHILQLLDRVRQLKDFVNNNEKSISYNPIKNEKFFVALSLAAILHDFGKISYKYQKRFYKEDFDSDLKKFLEPTKGIDIRHEILSSIWASILLDTTDGEMKEWLPKIRTAILLHHYNNFYIKEKDLMELVISYQKEIIKYLEFLKQKSNVIKEFLGKFLEKIKTSSDLASNAINYISIEDFEEKVDDLLRRIKERDDDISDFAEFYKTQIDENIKDEEIIKDWYSFFVFLGCLRRCDYSASGDVDIEHKKHKTNKTRDEMINLKEDVYKNLLENIKKSIGQEGKEIWQEKVLNKDTKNAVLIAPTGSGKTEFALLWAKNMGRKLIYTLPLRVALNDLFWRFKESKEPYFVPDFVDILHSTSFIEYLKGEDSGQDIDVGTKLSGARILSSPILLTTPDQVFLSSLKYYGFDKLLSVYPLSAIVIDEIQAYNPEMAAVIIKTLEIIRKLNGNVLIITATYPPYFKRFLNREQGFETIDLEEENKEIKSQIKNYNLKRHKIKLLGDVSLFEYEKKDGKYELKLINDSYEKIKTIVNENPEKNILIIVNNVGKAIELYKKIEEEIVNSKDVKINKENLYLLHSRLIEKEKATRIEKIKSKLKEIDKKRNENKNISSDERLILVATQIVEASVDVDFDILITEISPIDSQIQRWGRVWRNRDKNYGENNPNIIIFTGKHENNEIKIDRGTAAIYDKRVIEKTVEMLKNRAKKLNEEEFVIEEVLDYEKERGLIEEVFKEKIDNEKTLTDYYIEEIEKNLDWLKYYSAEKRSEAQRIFRNIAGIQVFVSNLPDENDEIYLTLCELLEDKKNWDLPLLSKEKDSIVKLVKNKIKDESLKQDEENLKWRILETLYKYSFNLPICGLENKKIKYDGLEKDNFKGFFILKEDTKDKLKEIKKFGVISLKDVSLDNLEIGLTESNIVE